MIAVMKASSARLKVLLLLGVFILIVLIKRHFEKYFMESSIRRYSMLNDFVRESDEIDRKYVLFWMKFFDDDFVKQNEGTWKLGDCPVKNCVFTNNKNLLKHHEFDAIVFHGPENWKLMDLPSTRSPHQVYVIALKE
jgi:hypothetical protein